jgi:hypothetical protein
MKNHFRIPEARFYNGASMKTRFRTAAITGWISLETHWQGPGGDKFQASVIRAASLKRLPA